MATDDTIAGGSLDGGNRNSPNFGLWGGCIIIIITVIASVLYFNRTRLIPAMQMTNGNVVAKASVPSKKVVVSTIKKSESTPSHDTFRSILDRDGNDNPGTCEQNGL